MPMVLWAESSKLYFREYFVIFLESSQEFVYCGTPKYFCLIISNAIFLYFIGNAFKQKRKVNERCKNEKSSETWQIYKKTQLTFMKWVRMNFRTQQKLNSFPILTNGQGCTATKVHERCLYKFLDELDMSAFVAVRVILVTKSVLWR